MLFPLCHCVFDWVSIREGIGICFGVSRLVIDDSLCFFVRGCELSTTKRHSQDCEVLTKSPVSTP